MSNCQNFLLQGIAMENRWDEKSTYVILCGDYNHCFQANPLPNYITNASIVPFGDSFLLVGGTDDEFGSRKQSTIYLYNPDCDSWTLQEARLKETKTPAIAMMVEREIFDLSIYIF
jgi:hypothetical protein